MEREEWVRDSRRKEEVSEGLIIIERPLDLPLNPVIVSDVNASEGRGGRGIIPLSPISVVSFLDLLLLLSFLYKEKVDQGRKEAHEGQR